MIKTDVAIVGGGAAGLACAVRLIKESGLKITVVEAGERVGKKLAASGNGQGNVTNVNMSADHYFGGNRAVAERLTCSEYAKNLEKGLFHMLLTSDGRGRVYPGGRQASALADSLLFDLQKGGVNLMTGKRVVGADKGFTLTLSGGEKIACRFLVLAAGGQAQKQFNTDGNGYALAKKLGHSVTALYPSLVQLKTDTTHIKTLKGIRADCILSAIVDGKVIAKKRGDVIFTDYGVSGNAAFEISPFVTDRQNVTLSLEFLPDNDDIESDIRNKKLLGYGRSELLSGTVHNQIGRAVIKRCASDDEREIAHMLKNFTLKVTGNLGFDYAQVTKGGVPLDEVTDCLESKRVKNLFFAGEILDVDGECGGYNLHWAFASGDAVAREIAARYKND